MMGWLSGFTDIIQGSLSTTLPNSTSTNTSTPKHKAVFSKIHYRRLMPKWCRIIHEMLKTILTDMIHGAGTEPWVEDLGSKWLQILYNPRPQMKNIVPWEILSALRGIISWATHLVKEDLFSMTTTLAPSSWASIAVRRPMGPAPTTTIWNRHVQVCLSIAVRTLVFEACMLSLNTGLLARWSSSLNKFTPRHDFRLTWKKR